LKKIKIINDNVKCPQHNLNVTVYDCMKCDNIFGKVEDRYILCKRGRNKDEFLEVEKDE